MNIFVAFFKSLYSPTYIGRFRFLGIGKTIGYVFFLMLIVSIPASVIVTQTVISTTNLVKDALALNLPDFTIQNGKLQSEEEEPLFFQKDNSRVIFDSTGEITISDLKEDEEVFALLQEDIYIASHNETYTFRYDQAGNIALTKDEISQFIDSATQLLPIFIPVYLIIFYIFSTGLKFVEITFLSLIGYLMKRSAPISLTYRHIWILSAYTVTLPTVLSMIIDILRIPFLTAANFFLYWLIAITMLFVVYKKLPTPKRKSPQVEK